MICPRIHFYEINDQIWLVISSSSSCSDSTNTNIRFPQYLREKVQSGLTLAWTFKAPLLQKTSPAELVAGTLYEVLADDVSNYIYVDFCAGAGGPTPFIERDLNSRLARRDVKDDLSSSGPRKGPSTHIQRAKPAPVKFVLTDIHPHIPDWTEAAKKSDNLSFVASSVDAANAPADMVEADGKKVFRLFNLAFHHFDDELAKAILKNTLETSDGFAIFELQNRTISSLLTVFAMGLLFAIITPFYFWWSPGTLFFTYIIPVIPFVLVVDGYVSSLRTRSPQEIQALMKACGASSDGWTIRSGSEQHTFPTGYMYWFVGIKT